MPKITFIILVLLLGLNIFTASSETLLKTPRAASGNNTQSSTRNNQNELTQNSINRNSAPVDFSSFGVRLLPGTTHRKDSRETSQTANRCKSLVYKTLKILPKTHTSFLRDLTLFYTKDGRRGLGGGSHIILRCTNVGDAELVSVLTHEMGHLVDENLLRGNATAGESGFYDFEIPLYENDPSLLYYRLSWKNEREHLDSSSNMDFCSGYGRSDPFEDFAECYTLFRVQGPVFRKLAEGNAVLAAKYDFLKYYVFDGEEFDVNSTISFPTNHRVFDSTTIPVSLIALFR